VLDRTERAVGGGFATIVEPTCGEGALLCSAAARFPSARLLGWELDAAHAAAARAALSAARATVTVASAFDVDWERALAGAPEPILVVGNPPWVTTAALGAIGGKNLPRRASLPGMTGLAALTGESNFDLAEWLILRLARALAGRRAALALLCKAAVARRVVERAGGERAPLSPGALFRVDARQTFGAAVDAVLLVARAGAAAPAGARWPVYASLDAGEPEGALSVEGDVLVADAAAFERTRDLAGSSVPEWRSGLKHDCAPVMELSRVGQELFNGLGERVGPLEPEVVHPLLKGSDVAHGRLEPARAVLVPQRTLGEDTARLRAGAPAAWAYLERHRARFEARKSRVYLGKPPFAIFGVGPYAFAPWKVAVSGLHKELRFALVGPQGGRPVMLDDTCYYLPFDDEGAAARAAAALGSERAREFFRGRVFWDAKRPITKALLSTLDLAKLGA
jgi:hypothetical protein